MDPFQRPPSRNGGSRRYSVASSGLGKMPSPNELLSPPSRSISGFGHGMSLDLPPLVNIPRSTTPLLSPSGMERSRIGRSSTGGYSSRGGLSDYSYGGSSSFSDLPPLPPLSQSLSGGRDGDYRLPPLDSSMDLPPLPPLGSIGRPSSRARRSSMNLDATSLDSGLRPRSHSASGDDFSELPPLPPLEPLPPLNLPGAFESPTSPISQTSHTSKGLRNFAKRTTFSNAQLQLMEDLWAETEYPSLQQVDLCAEMAGLKSKQIRTWFGNTRQARLAGTRKEARNAGLPGQPGSSLPVRRRSEFPSASTSGTSLPSSTSLPSAPLFSSRSPPNSSSLYGSRSSSSSASSLFPPLPPLEPLRRGSSSSGFGFGDSSMGPPPSFFGASHSRARRSSMSGLGSLAGSGFGRPPDYGDPYAPSSGSGAGGYGSQLEFP